MTLANAANFTMPDGPVTIVGLRSRNGHNVAFRSDSTPGMGRTVFTVEAPRPRCTFTVAHGKTLADAGSTGNSSDITVTPDYDFVFAGWSYVGADGATVHDAEPRQRHHQLRSPPSPRSGPRRSSLSYGPGSWPQQPWCAQSASRAPLWSMTRCLVTPTSTPSRS